MSTIESKLARFSSPRIWAMNGRAAVQGDVGLVERTAAELMRRTDTSPGRCRQADREQRERRDAMRVSGAADRLYPAAA